MDRPATDDDDELIEEEPTEVEVLEENWDTVQVFMRCRQEYAVSMAGAHALGFDAREIEAGCRLAGVAQEAWPQISLDVRDMGRIAAEVLNARAA